MSKASEREAVRLMELLRGERRKLSLNEVAFRSGLMMVSRVEKRERLPAIDTLLRITGAMDVDLCDLLARAKSGTG